MEVCVCVWRMGGALGRVGRSSGVGRAEQGGSTEVR